MGALEVSPALAATGLSLRPVVAGDEPFLRALFRSVRWDEFAALGWPDAARAQFIDTQYDYQQRHYAHALAGTDHAVIEQGGAPIGRLSLRREGPALHLVEISLLPDCRGQGLGARLLAQLQDEARALGCREVRLEVAEGNPARRLYARMGFVDIPPEDEFQRASREMVWAAS
jgi:ribosomal protein S18 acetylase RimI-like enzyme